MKKIIALLLISFGLQSQTLLKFKQIEQSGATGSLVITTGTNGVLTYTPQIPYSKISGTPSLAGYVPYTGANSFTTTNNITANVFIPTSSIVIGSPTYTDNNIWSFYQGSANNYYQSILQNSSNGSAASVDFVVSNDLGTKTNYYGNFGMNSSGYTGSPIFSKPNAVYLTAQDGDLCIGTTSNNAIHIAANNASSDAITVNSSNNTTVSGTFYAGSTFTVNGVSDFASAVGIGTTSPASSFSLDVRGKLLINDGSTVIGPYDLEINKSINGGVEGWVRNGTNNTAAFAQFATRANSTQQMKMGILSSSYATAGLLVPNTAYLMSVSADELLIGNQTTTKPIIFINGGTAAGNEIARFSAGNCFGINKAAPTATLDVTGTMSVSSTSTFAAQTNIYASGNVGLGLDKANTTNARVKMFVGDGTSGTSVDVGYMRVANSAFIFQAGSSGTTECLKVGSASTASPTVVSSVSFLENQGAAVASANNLALGFDGNTFEITGTTQINLISKTTWANGSTIRLLFTSTPVVKNAQVTSGSNIKILLAGGVDFSATADDCLTLVLSTVGGVQAWREVSRSVN